VTLFRQFFSAHLKGLLIWLAVGTALSLAMTRSAAPFINNRSMEALPPVLTAVFGDMTGLSPVDQYIVIALGKGTMLVPVLHGVLLALSVVTREVDRRTVDFILSLPVQRTQLLGARVAVLVTNLTLLVAATWAVLRYDLASQGFQGSWSHVGALMINLWLLAVAVSLAALAVSMWLDDYSVGVKLFLGVITLAYLLEFVLKGASVSRAGRVLSPFSYVDSAGVMRTGAIGTDALVLAAVGAAGLIVSFWAFGRKQFSA